MPPGGINPFWEPHAAEAASLTDCLGRGRLGDGVPAVSNGDLGFRAFRVTSRAGVAAALLRAVDPEGADYERADSAGVAARPGP